MNKNNNPVKKTEKRIINLNRQRDLKKEAKITGIKTNVSNNQPLSSTKNENPKKVSKKQKPKDKETKKNIRLIKKLNKKHNPKSAGKPNLNENEIIKLVNVEKYATNGYQFEHILKGIDLTIYKGEFVVIVGPSGSGKTTLLTILSALDRPSKGDCFMFDKNTITLSQSQLTKLRANHVGYIFQQYGLLQDLSVEDNIKIAANLTKEIKNKKLDLDKLLDSVGLLKYKKQKALNLSGGQAQRVAICRALIKNPDILFGDEPTGAIHINATKEIMNIFLDINKKFKTTIIIVTHNNAITELADRIIKIESGKITQNFKNQRRKTVEEINWSL
ncbi:MAG: ABC transporter ATP-binding protein [Malacoplasma sp.]|nr:ABC transporter ATP-binding protein [Malacoplasma sp.]